MVVGRRMKKGSRSASVRPELSWGKEPVDLGVAIDAHSAGLEEAVGGALVAKGTRDARTRTSTSPLPGVGLAISCNRKTLSGAP
jgi:hypothetical protein